MGVRLEIHEDSIYVPGGDLLVLSQLKQLLSQVLRQICNNH